MVHVEIRQLLCETILAAVRGDDRAESSSSRSGRNGAPSGDHSGECFAGSRRPLVRAPPLAGMVTRPVLLSCIPFRNDPHKSAVPSGDHWGSVSFQSPARDLSSRPVVASITHKCDPCRRTTCVVELVADVRVCLTIAPIRARSPSRSGRSHETHERSPSSPEHSNTVGDVGNAPRRSAVAGTVHNGDSRRRLLFPVARRCRTAAPRENAIARPSGDHLGEPGSTLLRQLARCAPSVAAIQIEGTRPVARAGHRARREATCFPRRDRGSSRAKSVGVEASDALPRGGQRVCCAVAV